MKKSISIFGVTGSVGNSTIELLRKNKSEFDLISITCNDDIDKIISLAKEFNPKFVAIANKKKFKELKKNLPNHIKCLFGTEGICEAASYESDIVVASIVGLAGLRPLIESIKSSSIIALANKECVVSAGSLIKKLAKIPKTLILIQTLKIQIRQETQKKSKILKIKKLSKISMPNSLFK